MHYLVTNVIPTNGYTLTVEFADGTLKSVDLSEALQGEIFAPLHDQAYFNTVAVHPELETIFWENGADFAPEYLYDNGVLIEQ